MTTKHTPAPWTINKTWGTIEGPQEQEICAIHPADASGRREPRATARANAALIAAAPDLLEALKAIVNHWRAHDDAYFESDLATDALDAIRKAEGER